MFECISHSLFRDFLFLKSILLEVQHIFLTMHFWNKFIVIIFSIWTILFETQMSHEFKMSLKRQSLDEIINNYRRWKNSNDKNYFLLNFLSQLVFINIHMTKFDDKLRTVMIKDSNRLTIITLNSYFWI